MLKLALVTTLTALSLLALSHDEAQAVRCGDSCSKKCRNVFIKAGCIAACKRERAESCRRGGANVDHGWTLEKAVKNAESSFADAVNIGLNSAKEICGKVGLKRCINPQFIWTYQTLRLGGQVSGLISNATDCAALAYTAQEYGPRGIQAYGAVKGIAVPPKMAELATRSTVRDINDACGVLFRGSVNTGNLVLIKSAGPSSQDIYADNDLVETIKSSIPVDLNQGSGGSGHSGVDDGGSSGSQGGSSGGSPAGVHVDGSW